MTHVIGSPVWTARHRLPALVSFTLFLIFSIAGGIAIGAGFGALLGSTRLGQIVFGILAVVLVSRDLFYLRIPLPQVRLQVPEGLKTRRVLGPMVYGAILGAGVFTYLPSTVVYIYILALLLLASALEGAVVGGIFGASYAAAALLLGARTATLTAVHQAAHVKALFTRGRWVTLTLAAIISILLSLTSLAEGL